MSELLTENRYKRLNNDELECDCCGNTFSQIEEFNIIRLDHRELNILICKKYCKNCKK